MIGITAGCWDLLHAGHILFLKEAKNRCDYLIVLLQTDPTIDRPDTKNKPIESLLERQIKLNACKYIDEVVVYSTEEELLNILKTVPHDIRFLGSDYRDIKDFTGKNLYQSFQNYQSKKVISYIDRNHDYSTTSLRTRIMDQYKNMVKKS